MSLNSFSETSGNSFLKTGFPHSFIDSKELSLLDDLEFTPVQEITSEVFQVENPHFTENDWKVQDPDHLIDGLESSTSERSLESPERNFLDGTLKNGSPWEFENILWEENYDFFQEGDELLAMVDTSNSNEDELVSFFSFLKTDGGSSNRYASKKTKTAIGSSVPSCTDRTSNRGAVKERFLNSKKMKRLRLLEKKSSEGLFDELEFDESYFKVKGSLFIKEDGDAIVQQKSSYRVVGHHKKRSRRFPVDRSSLLRSVLTKNVTYSVL